MRTPTTYILSMYMGLSCRVVLLCAPATAPSQTKGHSILFYSPISRYHYILNAPPERFCHFDAIILIFPLKFLFQQGLKSHDSSENPKASKRKKKTNSTRKPNQRRTVESTQKTFIAEERKEKRKKKTRAHSMRTMNLREWTIVVALTLHLLHHRTVSICVANAGVACFSHQIRNARLLLEIGV